jgi:hypothetical protein
MESSASAGRVASAVVDPRRWWALALLCGASFMVLLERTAHRFLPPRPPAAAIADNANQEEEQTMAIYEDLMKAVQDDARRAGERDRLLFEARRARRARRQRLVSAAPARRRTEMGKIVVSENVTLDGVIQGPAGDDGFRADRWVGLIGNSPQLAKLALDETRAAGAFLLCRRSYEWLAARWPLSQRRAGGQVEQPAQVRRVRDPRQSRLEQLDSPQGRRA